ncbi:MAG: hypothetical protein RR246_04455 [Clostridia bacterium]
MKKLLAIVLAFTFVFAFAACNSNKEESNSTSSSNSAAGGGNTSSKEASKEASSEASKEASKAEESSKPDEPKLPEFIPAFIYVNGQVYKMSATMPESIRLTKINEAPVVGDSVLFTTDYGTTIKTANQDFSEFFIFVVEYNKEKFMYLKKQIITPEDKSDKSQIAIPSDGFVVAIHKSQKSSVNALGKVKDDIEIYPCGVSVNDFSYTIKKTDKKPVLDGKVSTTEWEKYRIDKINEKNPNWDYRLFDKDNYGIIADLYCTYDDKNIYYAMVVQSPNCTWLPTAGEGKNNGEMYAYECLQFNICDQSVLSDYMLKHFQYPLDPLAVNEDHVRQYGFCGSAKNESLTHVYWGGKHNEFTGEFKVVRDEKLQQTTYEISIPWAEANIEADQVKKGTKFSFAFSVNSSTSKDKWQNIRMRNGGSIIGMNEFTKMAIATLAD